MKIVYCGDIVGRAGRDAVLKLIEEGLEKPLTFKDYPMSPDYILNLRKKINDAVKEKLNG